MLAHFPFLGVFFSFLPASLPLVGLLLLMLVVFWPFWDAPGLILDCPEPILKCQNRIFRGFVARAGLQCENIAHVLKPQFFQTFEWFLHIARFALQPQSDAKAFPEPVEHSFLQRLCSKRILGWILGGFGAL